jgi:hypothetical protein
MDWKKEAIEKLERYDARKRSIASIHDEITMLELQSVSIRSATADGTPVQGGGNGREDALLTNKVKREELTRDLALAKLWCKMVERSLDALTSEERLVLDRFYIHRNKGNVDRLCEELHLERSAVYARRDAALYHFTIAHYGFSES